MKIIFILGGFLKKNRDGNYRSDKLSYLRVLAGYYFYKKLSEENKKNQIELIVSGGKGIYRKMPGIPSVAPVMKQELIELGINAKDIKVDKTDFTFPELVWLKKHISGKKAETFVITNAYHLPRIRTMINVLPELKKLKNRVELVPAEKIVAKFNKKMGPTINNLNKSLRMRKMIASEKRGINALKRSGYKFK